MKKDARPYIPVVGFHFGMPEGMAATQRATNIAKLITLSGFSSEVVVGCPSETASSKRNLHASGKSDSVDYIYPGKLTINRSIRFIRWLERLLSVIRTARYLRKRKPACIILYSRFTPYIRLLNLFLGRKRVPFVFEICEWPLALQHDSSMTLRSALLTYDYGRVIKNRADGALVISSFIEKEVSKIRGGEFSVFRLPVVAGQPFWGEATLKVRGDSVVYVGSWAYRAEVLLLLNAFEKAFKSDSSLKLELFLGSSYSQNKHEIDRTVDASGLREFVSVTGFIAYEELQAQLATAGVLVSVMRASDASRARFPNKLVEYFFSGRPVIVSAIGDVLEFVQDGVSAILVTPDSVESLAAGILRYSANTEKGHEIGLNGRAVAQKSFLVDSYRDAFREYLLKMADLKKEDKEKMKL